jgi:hypothetical protein
VHGPPTDELDLGDGGPPGGIIVREITTKTKSRVNQRKSTCTSI